MRLADDLSCAELVELVTAYLDGSLTPHDSTRFEQHINTCEGCSNHLAQMRRTIETVGRLAPESLDGDAERDLLAAFRTWKQP
jgi:anti-sigma factor RsiW